MKRTLRLIILISGKGSNLQAIIDAIQNKKLNAEILAVISDKPEAYGLIRAKKANIDAKVLLAKDFHSREMFDQALAKLIASYQPDLIAMAGFMRILSPPFVKQFSGKIINIHPSLLPKYRGLHTHKQVLANGDKIHGCTIHFVTEDLDSGPIIAAKSLSVKPDDTEESLKQRIHALEHQLYPEVLQWFSEKLV